jgi:hypothetical protein
VTDALILDSLKRRMRAMHSLYEDATATMTVEQVNYFEREPLLPIAFSLFHFINMEDASMMLLGAGDPVYNDDWAGRIHPAINDHGKHRTVAEMVHQRIGDYDAFLEYQAAVFERTESFVASLDPSALTRVVIERPFPDMIASTYSARVAGEPGITVLDGLECWVYQHGLRHMGEIEHGRALVGLEGMTS